METFVGSVVDRAVRCGSSRIVGIQTLMFQVSTKKLQCDLGDKSKRNSHLVGECFIEEQTGKTEMSQFNFVANVMNLNFVTPTSLQKIQNRLLLRHISETWNFLKSKSCYQFFGSKVFEEKV